MSWEITIINGGPCNRRPLGTQKDVVQAIADAIPGVHLQRPPVPPQAVLDMMPQAIRDALTQSRLEADFEHDEFAIHLYATDSETLDFVDAEIRGSGDPLPYIRSICNKTGWTVIDASDQSVVNLANVDPSAWARFQQWREMELNLPGSHDQLM